MDVIVGTAGHIDHGKTALIKALTGTDADRLPEEKRRGITVDLGFAEMAAGDLHFGFVDVPGHERFVKNMLAGASGIDIVLLVIAADEGVMPQTREHFDICRLLGISTGVVVLTKTDIAESDVLELARLEVSELVAGTFLSDAERVEVSSRTGSGIDILRQALVDAAARLPQRDERSVTFLPVDRSFSVKGFGTVVTGTLSSGIITEGAELAVLPGGRIVRVRGLQSHGHSAESVHAGQRAAINLGGVDHADIDRGAVLTEPGVLTETQIIDAEIRVLANAAKPLRSRQRLRIHIGTVEALARVQILNPAGEIPPVGKDLAQIRLEVPVAALPGQRFIARSYSPQVTIAGGIVIDTHAAKHRRKDLDAARRHLTGLLAAAADDEQKVGLLLSAAGATGMSFADLRSRTGFRIAVLESALEANISAGRVLVSGTHYITRDAFDLLAGAALAELASFHKRQPLAKGISREELVLRIFGRRSAEVASFLFSFLLSSGQIAAERDTLRLASHRTELLPEAAALSKRLLDNYRTAGLHVPKLDEALSDAMAGTSSTQQEARKLLQLHLDSGEIAKVTDDLYFASEALDKLADALQQFAGQTADRMIDVAQFKDVAGVSRKYAIPLLEFLDRTRVTRRAGEKRLIL